MIGRYLGFLLMLAGTVGWADEIVPDRPGFSTGTYTVAPGYVHIELGFQSSYGDHAGDPDSYTAPLINLRIGATETTEINLLWDGVNIVRDGNGASRSTTDMLLGAKHRLYSSERYNISVLGYVSLPTGNGEDSGSFTPFLGLLWDHVLTPSITAFGTLQFISFVEEGRRSDNFQPSVGVSFTHTDTLSTYVEVYSDMPLNTDTDSAEVFDAGIAYLVTDDIQIDFNFGVSLDRRSGDFFGAGIAVRF